MPCHQLRQMAKSPFRHFAKTGFSLTSLAVFVVRPQAGTQIGAAHQGWSPEDS
jgi:hypothetical protein